MKSFLIAALAILSLASCTNYGKKAKSGSIEVYYKDGISEEAAEKTASLFNQAIQSSNPGSSGKKSFQLTKPGDTVLLKMVVDKDKLEQLSDNSSLYAIISLVSDSVFKGAPVNLALTDDKFKEFKTLAYKKAEPPVEERTSADGFGQKFESGNTEVFTTGASDEEANKLAAYLDGYFKPTSTYSFQFVKDNSDGTYIVRMVANPDKVNTLGNEFFVPVCKGICENVLSVPAINFELTDPNFNTLRVYKYPADAGATENNN